MWCEAIQQAIPRDHKPRKQSRNSTLTRPPARLPARCAGWSVFRRSTCLLSKRRDQAAISKMSQKVCGCWGWGMPTPYAGSMSDWVRWVEKAKTVKFSGFINLWSWRTPRKHSREDRRAYPRALGPQAMGKVRKAQVAMTDISRTENCLCVGEMPIKPEDQPSVKDVVGLFDVWDTSQYLSLRCHQELGLYWRG